MRRWSLFVLILLLSSLTWAPGASHVRRRAGSRRVFAEPVWPGCMAGLPSVEYQMLLDEMLLHLSRTCARCP